MVVSCPVESLEAAARSALKKRISQSKSNCATCARHFGHSRLQSYHAPLVGAVEDISADAWQRLLPCAVAEVVAADGQSQGTREGLRESWAGALRS